MDPNVTLAELREMVARWNQATQVGDPAAKAYAEYAADAADRLDQWLSKGGFLPDAWRDR